MLQERVETSHCCHLALKHVKLHINCLGGDFEILWYIIYQVSWYIVAIIASFIGHISQPWCLIRDITGGPDICDMQVKPDRQRQVCGCVPSHTWQEYWFALYVAADDVASVKFISLKGGVLLFGKFFSMSTGGHGREVNPHFPFQTSTVGKWLGRR